MAAVFVEKVNFLNESFEVMQKKLYDAVQEITILQTKLAGREEAHVVAVKKAFDEGLDMGERGVLGGVMRRAMCGSSSCSARR